MQIFIQITKRKNKTSFLLLETLWVILWDLKPFLGHIVPLESSVWAGASRSHFDQVAKWSKSIPFNVEEQKIKNPPPPKEGISKYVQQITNVLPTQVLS